MATSPEFIEPEQHDDAAVLDDITLDIGGDEPLVVTNFVSTLEAPTFAKDRNGLVKAGLASPASGLDADGLHAVARAVTSPAAGAVLLKNNLATSEVVGANGLNMLPNRVWLTEVFPVLQPRALGSASDVRPPQVKGLLAEDGTAEPVTVMTFDDHDHLSATMKETVRQTLTMGRDYGPSILAKRVSRPILTHVARLEFTDGSEPFLVLTGRDGITRAVRSWANLLPADATHDEIATHIADNLLASKAGSAGRNDATANQARGREAYQKSLRAEFAEGMADGKPNEKAIRIGQTFTLPAQVIVGITEHGTSPVAPEERFDDAVQAMIASVHSEFQPWHTAASDASVIHRALPRAVHDKALDPEVADLATGRLTVADVPTVFGDPDIPATALWRAVYLICWLCAPTEFNGIKKHLRALLGRASVRNRAYVMHLLTLIDLPWRAAKSHTEKQTFRAWRNGGPIPTEILGVDWNPVPTTDFTELVPIALDDDDEDQTNARYTLQVAGGLALITDKLLMANVGSAVDVESVPFRSDVDDVISGLGDTEYGLWLLAHAANAFQADKYATSAYTKRELNSNPALVKGAYRVPMPSADDPSTVVTDNTGQPRPLTPWIVVEASDPARAARAKADEEAEAEAKKKAKPKGTAAERAADLRKRINGALADSVEALTLVTDIAQKNPAVGPPLGTYAEWTTMNTTAQQISVLIFSNPSPQQAMAVGQADDTVDEETDDDDLENEEQA
ncbi:hypothetical protein AB0H36_43275 [Kribbella sp. NPDC050820]|uniref:hypothetical protein n=1 Tax=Kribbella sp. NPDC050820 TaxID=3155408 RepID=UPI00340CE89B